MDYDYKGIFSEDYHKTNFGSYTKEFSIKLVERKSLIKHWEGTVSATSKKHAQSVWRKQYAEIRSQYDHSYTLIIEEITD
jgi:hypothetical protein